MMEEFLPIGWIKSTLEEVAEWGSGGTPSRNNPKYFSGAIPWIKTGELGPKYIHGAEEHITEEAIQKSSAKIFPIGSVGIAMYGATIGKLSIWGIDASTNQACAVAQTYSEVLFNEYLYYFLFSEKRNIIRAGKGGAQPNISQGILKEWKIPLPPLNEQKRIVAKIEELFSELDKGIETFKTAREQLKVYRQAVLKHAFEGKLTSVWRDKNKDRLETAGQLLDRIKKERRAKWEAELLDKGKDPAKVKYVEPKAQEVEGLPELPKEWVWISLEMIASTVKHSISSGPFGSALGTKDYISIGIPVIRGQNISNGAFLASEFVFISEAKAAQLIRSFTYPGDLIVVAVGSSGKAAILPRFVERGILSQNCNKITLDKSLVLPKFVELAMQTDIAINQLKNKTTDTVRQFLSLTNLKQTVIPLLPLTEQEQIVAEVERLYSIIAELEELIEASLKRAEKLQQSILRKAFAGRLVSQDPNDEPASELLERIRFEKTTIQTNNKSNHQHKVKSIKEYTQSSLIRETAV